MENAALYATREILYLPVDRIRPNPYQPRKFFERGALEELADSIREYGVMQPISVRLINGCSYELVAGERRLRASRLAGLAVIPAIIVNINDQDSAILAIIENLQRQNLNYLEEAEGFQNLAADYGFTQEELARRVGKSQSTVANKLRLLRLSKSVRKLLLEHDLTERHARALLRLEDEDAQLECLQKVVKDGLTVKRTEELVERMLTVAKVQKKNGHIRQKLRDVRILTNTVKHAVDLISESGMEADFIMTETEAEYEFTIVVAKL